MAVDEPSYSGQNEQRSTGGRGKKKDATQNVGR